MLYDGYPQIEDGIGITRHFLENLETYLGRTKVGSSGRKSRHHRLRNPDRQHDERAVDDLNRHTGSLLDVAVIENAFFGDEINISGLLTGGDLIRAIGAPTTDAPLYISSRMISDRTHTLLDDLTIDEVAAAGRTASRPVSDPLRRRARSPPPSPGRNGRGLMLLRSPK